MPIGSERLTMALLIPYSCTGRVHQAPQPRAFARVPTGGPTAFLIDVPYAKVGLQADLSPKLSLSRTAALHRARQNMTRRGCPIRLSSLRLVLRPGSLPGSLHHPCGRRSAELEVPAKSATKKRWAGSLCICHAIARHEATDDKQQCDTYMTGCNPCSVSCSMGEPWKETGAPYPRRRSEPWSWCHWSAGGAPIAGLRRFVGLASLDLRSCSRHWDAALFVRQYSPQS